MDIQTTWNGALALATWLMTTVPPVPLGQEEDDGGKSERKEEET